jgi:hypothetical protein
LFLFPIGDAEIEILILIKGVGESLDTKYTTSETLYQMGALDMKEPSIVYEENLTEKEKEYIKNREEKICKKGLEALFPDKKITKIPKIAFVGSGGSLRSTVCSVGFMNALKEAKILDTIQYFSSLSGSNWATLSFYSSDLEISEFKEKMNYQGSFLNITKSFIKKHQRNRIDKIFDKKN